MSEQYDYKGEIFIVKNAEKYIDKINKEELNKIDFHYYYLLTKDPFYFYNEAVTPDFLLFENKDNEKKNKYCLSTYTYFYEFAECDGKLLKGFWIEWCDTDEDGNTIQETYFDEEYE